MEIKNQYRTTIKNYPLLYQETRRISQLLLKGATQEEIMVQVVEHDYLQLSSLSQKKGTGKELLYRLSLVDKTVQEMIQQEDVQTSKTLVVYSILCADRLFHEFAREVYFDKIITLRSEISKKEVIRFLERKAQTNEIIANWKEYTLDRLARSFLQVLKEAGWVKELKKSCYEIEKPIISTKARNYLKKEGAISAVEVVLGELL